MPDAIPHKARGRGKEVAVPEADEQTKQERHFRNMSPKLRSRGTAPIRDAQTHAQVSRANRYCRYQAVCTLHQQGFSQREIARRLKTSRETIRGFLRAESFPERSQPTRKARLLEPHKAYLLKRWQEGCWNGTQLYSEIKARGYTGSASYLRRFIADLRKKHQAAGNPGVLTSETAAMTVNVPTDLPSPPHLTPRLSPTRASWLCVCQPTKLDEKQRHQVEHMRLGHRDLDIAYQRETKPLS